VHIERCEFTRSYGVLLVTLGKFQEYRVFSEDYKERFESPFIAATEKYYKTESDTFLEQNSISAYLKRAEERLREEEDRVERYFNANARGIVSIVSTS
jgi:Cullin family